MINIELQKKAIDIRKSILEMVYHSQSGHIGSDFSCVEIMVALYYGVLKNNPQNPKAKDRDRYVQSKGHAVETYWAILADLGYIEHEELQTFSQYQSRLIGHPNNKVPGVELNTGSLGHGLSLSVGIAIAAKLDNAPYQTYTLLGDGELAEGSVWEAAMAASHYSLDNLTAIIDKNTLQITGKTVNVMNVHSLKEKWEAFGWDVFEVDGHDIDALQQTLQQPSKGKPKMILAHTTKGKGSILSENKAEWHHKVLKETEYIQIKKELDKQLEVLQHGN